MKKIAPYLVAISAIIGCSDYTNTTEKGMSETPQNYVPLSDRKVVKLTETIPPNSIVRLDDGLCFYLHNMNDEWKLNTLYSPTHRYFPDSIVYPSPNDVENGITYDYVESRSTDPFLAVRLSSSPVPFQFRIFTDVTRLPFDRSQFEVPSGGGFCCYAKPDFSISVRPYSLERLGWTKRREGLLKDGFYGEIDTTIIRAGFTLERYIRRGRVIYISSDREILCEGHSDITNSFPLESDSCSVSIPNRNYSFSFGYPEGLIPRVPELIEFVEGTIEALRVSCD